eukprot:4396376-Pleurochrysis_carterae.AAC.1
MPETDSPTDTVLQTETWDLPQLSQGTWLDNMLPWLPTCNSSYTSLVEHNYKLTPQSRIYVHSYQHVQAVFFNL